MEEQITAALCAEAGAARLPDDMLDRIKRAAAAAKPKPWYAHRLPQLAAGVLAVVLLAGWGAERIYTVPALPPGAQGVPGASSKPRLVRTVAPRDLGATVGFSVRYPSYLPKGMVPGDAGAAGDSHDATARLRVAEFGYSQPGRGYIVLWEWQADQAAPFPPASVQGDVIDTAPWYRTLHKTTVELSGHGAVLMTYLLSGMTEKVIYWNDNGINYAVGADDGVSAAELLKVAASLH